jgi:hypothetical protein
LARSLELIGAIDMHCHFGPDPRRGRSVDALEAVTDAKAAGHAGIVLKSHDFPSAALATIVERCVGGIRVFGGICCDAQVGGVNPAAVEAALRIDGKVVWLATHSAKLVDPGSASRPSSKGGNVSVLNAVGELTAEANEVLDLIAEHGAILATGHSSRAEHFAVTTAFAQRGKVLITHAREAHAQPDLSVQDCIELADMGATIEISAVTCLGTFPCRDVSEMAALVQEVGAARCIISSDFGQRSNPHPVEGMKGLGESLVKCGIAVDDVRAMACSNPARLLDLQ